MRPREVGGRGRLDSSPPAPAPEYAAAVDWWGQTAPDPARLAQEIPDAFYVNQFGNPANPLAHEMTTGPEILEDLPEVTHVVEGTVKLHVAHLFEKLGVNSRTEALAVALGRGLIRLR